LAGCGLGAKLAGWPEQGKTTACFCNMSEFKFACPVCGQHIKCDSARSGAPLECPTCFRKIVVPQAPADEDSKLILNAAQVTSRPGATHSAAGRETPASGKSRRATLVFGIGMVVVACAVAGAVFVFREEIFKRFGVTGDRSPNSTTRRETNALAPTLPVPVEPGTNWTLSLADRPLPATPATGFINGRSFVVERAAVQGGLLVLQEGWKWPPDAGWAVYLSARNGEDLAGRSITVEANHTNAPKVLLRSPDDQQQPVTQTFRTGYALRIEFGPVTAGRLPGRIYLCAPDAAKSWVAGTFDAEIRKPPPPKPPKAPKR